MKNNKVLELSIKANCMRILEILETKSLGDLITPTNDWGTLPREKTELIQRMAILRKDTMKAEKHLKEIEY